MASRASGPSSTELMALGVLLLVAAGSVVTGELVPPMEPAANWVFGLACTALVAYGVSRLRVLREAVILMGFWRR